MEIFLTFNNNYSQHAAVAIRSIISNNHKETINFHIICNDMEKSNLEKLSSFSNKNVRIRFYTVDLSRFESFKRNIERIPVEGYFRYIIPELVPHLAKALYLDVDTVVKGSLTELWNTDIDQYYIAGVHDRYIQNIGHKKELGFGDSDLYVNAGVLLLNLNKIRDDNKDMELFFNTVKYSHIIQFQDQDVINLTFKGKIKPVSNIYNYTVTDLVENPPAKIKDAIVIHYNGPRKPWDYFFLSGNPAEKYYWKYLLKTPYRGDLFRALYKRLLSQLQ